MGKRIEIEVVGENIVDTIIGFEKSIPFYLKYNGNYSDRYSLTDNNKMTISIKSIRCSIYKMFLKFFEDNKISYKILK